MAVKHKIPYAEGIYFITFTCCRWLNLIEITNSYDLVYSWFDYLKQHQHLIIGYEIMPNHIHCIIALRLSDKNINKVIGDGKRFIAYEIIIRLKALGHIGILEQLEKDVNGSDKKRGKLHEVWEDSFDWKLCNSLEMIVQKLNYMHTNPCKGKWNLVDSPVDYPHGSARFYITGEQGVYSVTNYMELGDINLTKK